MGRSTAHGPCDNCGAATYYTGSTSCCSETVYIMLQSYADSAYAQCHHFIYDT